MLWGEVLECGFRVCWSVKEVAYSIGKIIDQFWATLVQLET